MNTLAALATPLSPVLVSITNNPPSARPSGALAAYEPPSTTPTYQSPYTDANGSLNGLGIAVAGLSLISAFASAFHGVKRNKGSVGYGLLWGAEGALFPVVTPAIAIAQGYAKPEGK
jgi:hypothetical protein